MNTSWADLQDIEDEKEKPVCIDAGGVHFYTSRKTIAKSSVLQKIVGEEKYVFIDRDPTAFLYVLNFLRTGKMCYSIIDTIQLEFIKNEAKYFHVNMQDMCDNALLQQLQ
tara:strand:- start:111 stop:440 length:330 start_codon:yes stop_codon:yes gene_type:complete